MSKPGIENKRKLPWKLIAGAGAIGAGLLALSQCDSEQQPAPEQPETSAPEEQGPQRHIYRYDITENTPLRMSGSADAQPKIYVRKGSCVEGMLGPDGKDAATPDRKFAQVSAMAADGVNASDGWVETKKIRNAGVRTGGKACTAEFITSAETAPEKQTAVEFFAVSNRAVFYNSANEAGTPVAAAGDGSCVKGTGIERGNMMQVEANGEQYWAPKENFRPAQSFITAETCAAKMDFTP